MMWANMVEAYEPPARRRQGEDRRTCARATASRRPSAPRCRSRSAWRSRRSIPDAEHPVVRTHPETGEKVLFVNAFTTHFTNYHTPENVRFGQDANPGASQLLNYLISQAFVPEFQVRFRWQHEQRGDLGQPLHAALRGAWIICPPPQDGARRDHRRQAVLKTPERQGRGPIRAAPGVFACTATFSYRSTIRSCPSTRCSRPLRSQGARRREVTFFHAQADYGASSVGALERVMAPGAFNEPMAGEARALLAKAEVVARTAGVRSRLARRRRATVRTRPSSAPRRRAAATSSSWPRTAGAASGDWCWARRRRRCCRPHRFRCSSPPSSATSRRPRPMHRSPSSATSTARSPR